ncbi:MAG: KpsF/GutQ family sugar-phosphate isomerase [Candidatus Dadabacteria bacterium]|nr:MAG: KpsF/GutQ family sugar-phosphate isomerase [Candidatus Dadabacteria bacterium]
MNTAELLQRARAVIDAEIEGLAAVRDTLGESFARAVQILADAPGKVVVIGIGKSGIAGRKLAATLTSTGTPAVFLHATEGGHGDLGIVQRGDAALMISYSGANRELLDLVEPVQRLGVPIIAMTGNLDSELARLSDVCLSIAVPAEACPMGLAPTTSTTATLALGDALAVVLLEVNGFGPEDFAALHPGGALGRRLRRIRDRMRTGGSVPLVAPDTPMQQVLVEMSSKRLGVTGVTENDKLVGVITDGDLRRALEREGSLLERVAADVMTRAPRTISGDATIAAALDQMEQHKITVLFVVDSDGRPEGAIHLHDLIDQRSTS